LKQEMTSKMNYIKELHEQQEETVAKQGEAQKEVLVRCLLLCVIYIYIFFVLFVVEFEQYKHNVIVMNLDCKLFPCPVMLTVNYLGSCLLVFKGILHFFGK